MVSTNKDLNSHTEIIADKKCHPILGSVGSPLYYPAITEAGPVPKPLWDCFCPHKMRKLTGPSRKLPENLSKFINISHWKHYLAGNIHSNKETLTGTGNQ